MLSKEELYKKLYEAIELIQDHELRNAQEVLESLMNKVEFIKEIK